MAKCCVWFTSKVVLGILADHPHSGVISPEDIFPEVLVLFIYNLANLSRAAKSFLERRGFLQTNLFLIVLTVIKFDI